MGKSKRKAPLPPLPDWATKGCKSRLDVLRSCTNIEVTWTVEGDLLITWTNSSSRHGALHLLRPENSSRGFGRVDKNAHSRCYTCDRMSTSSPCPACQAQRANFDELTASLFPPQ